MINNEKPIRYFDNSATSFPKPPGVGKAVFNAINQIGSPNRGAYPIAVEASRIVYSAREHLAKLFNCDDPLSVVFTSGATESLNIAIYGLISPGDHVITTVAEHNSVLRPLYRIGCEIDFVPCDNSGNLIFDNLEKLITSKTKAIIATHVSNVTGIRTDIEYLSKLCRQYGLYFILDAAQSAGVMPVDSSLASVTCFTGHKSLFGPQGTGGLIVNQVDINQFKTGGSGHHSFSKEHPKELPDRLEAGTLNCHGIAGLQAGVKFIEDIGLSIIEEKERALLNRFLEGIKEIKNIKLYGDYSQRTRGAVVSILIDGYDSAEISSTLSEKFNIATRSGSHCAPLLHKALNTEKSGLTRFSFSFLNTFDEIDYALEALMSFKE